MQLSVNKFKYENITLSTLVNSNIDTAMKNDEVVSNEVLKEN